MLKDLQARVIEVFPDIEVLKEHANEEFERHRSQSGFVLVARKMLIESSKGRNFNEVREYLDECFSAIETNELEIDKELTETKVDLWIRWQFQRTPNKTDWPSFKEDVSKLIQSNQYYDDPLRSFYLAVACAHTDEMTRAESIFRGLRNLRLMNYSPWMIRCYYVDDNGNPMNFQGTLHGSDERQYISIPEINTDVLVASRGRRLSRGLTIHVYVGFTFNGLTAVYDPPTKKALELPSLS